MASWVRPYAKAGPEPEDKDDLDALFVFGYQCKIFREDERAEYVDQGRHLIPWMGDPSLMIDRYDGRGHLFDLKPYDAIHVPKENFEIKEEERVIEELCDEERYLELHTDLAEQAVYEEEEIKRINEAYNDNPYAAVGFNYERTSEVEGESQEQQSAEQGMEDDEEEEHYEPDPDLQVPSDMHTPPSNKSYAIMEKTAKFISQQGQQMEIVIKMKQKNNPQFDFLDFSHYLNPFYRHLVKMIKCGKYKPEARRRKSHSGDHYLHPSLARNEKLAYEPVEIEISRQKFLRSVQSKLPAGQIMSTPYAKLLKLAQPSGRNSPDPNAVLQTKKLDIIPSESQAAFSGNYLPSTPAECPAYPYTHTTPYNEQSQVGIPPPPGMEPVTLPEPTQPPPPGTVPPEPPSTLQLTEQPAVTDPYSHPQTGAMDPTLPINIIPPSQELQPIVDKMASYVAKNGPDFETVVKSKEDTRFDFLHSGHVLYPYYQYKKHCFEKAFASEKHATKTLQNVAGKIVITKNVTLSKGEPKADKPVSFSIRAKEPTKEPAMGSRKPVLLYESSDDEGEKHSPVEGEEWSEPQEVKPPVVVVQQEVRLEKPLLSTEEQERKLAEERLKDKLAAAARDKLAQASKEEQIKAERKRKAAMFISMLKGSGSAATTAAVPVSSSQNEESAGNNDVPVVTAPVALCSSPKEAAITQVPYPTKPTAVSVTPRSLSPVHSGVSHPEKRRRSRSRSRSRSRRKHYRRSRSPKKRRSRSPKRRSRSPRRKREKTPPSAYSIIRKSRSPPKKRKSKSRSPILILKKKHKRSRSRSIPRKPRRSRSSSKTKKSRSSSPNSKIRSRSKTPKSKRSKSPARGRSKRKSKSRSPPLKSRKRSKSRSPSKVCKSKSPVAKNRNSRTKSPSVQKRSRSKSQEKIKAETKSRSPSVNKEKSKSQAATLEIVRQSPAVEPRARSHSPEKNVISDPTPASAVASNLSKIKEEKTSESLTSRSSSQECQTVQITKETSPKQSSTSRSRSNSKSKNAVPNSPRASKSPARSSVSKSECKSKRCSRSRSVSLTKTAKRSRSRSTSKVRKHSRSRSKSKPRLRLRSRSASRSKSSKSKSRKRSRSRSRPRTSKVKKRSKSRSPVKSKSSKSRRRSRSKSKSRAKRRSRSHSVSKSSRKRSHSRSPLSKSKSKKKSKRKSRSRSISEDRTHVKSKSPVVAPEPQKSQGNGSIINHQPADKESMQPEIPLAFPLGVLKSENTNDASLSTAPPAAKVVSTDLMSKVRAMLRASRQEENNEDQG